VKVVSILLSVTGILFIELSTFLDHDLQHSLSWNIIWSFLQPIFFGLAIWKMERYIYICQNDSLVIQAFCFVILCTISVISFLWLSLDLMYPTIQNHFSSAFSLSSNVSAVLFPSITEQFFNVMTNWKIILIVCWISLIVTAVLTFNDNYAMKSISAVDATIIYLTDPIWVTICALIFIGEMIEWYTIVGAVFILSACLVSSCHDIIIKKLSLYVVSNQIVSSVTVSTSVLSASDP
jgi:drug/metabolite transporter (DMT)-like permease